MKTLKIVPLIALLLAGCKDATGPTNVEGRWIGNAGSVSFDFSLEQDGREIIGTGLVARPEGSNQVDIAGERIGVSVSFFMSAGLSRPNWEFAGTLSGNRLNGRINGTGVNNAGITFTRQ